MTQELSCFKSYDVRGQIGLNLDEKIVYRISRSTAQHLKAKKLILGYDARETSLTFAIACAEGALDAGSDVLWIGLAGTEEMYWAVNHFKACAGIEITASHNPINYNGMKIVKSKARPLNEVKDFLVIKKNAELDEWPSSSARGQITDVSFEARQNYVNRVLSFVDVSKLQGKKIVVNFGNGAAGPTFDAIEAEINKRGANLGFIKVHHAPNPMFPHGIPNPLLPENHPATSDVVKKNKADLGVAFDGDFDRCFFFDNEGNFIPGEYIVGLLATIFLTKNPGSGIVYEPRVIWNTEDIIKNNNGVPEVSRAGHSFIKQRMRLSKAIYGGEISAHHYFRDFAFCDSGMIPWLLIVELLCQKNVSMVNLVRDRSELYFSSGEINFSVKDPRLALRKVLDKYGRDAKIDNTDGLSLSFSDWRFNLRRSKTENLLRLNVESYKNKHVISWATKAISDLIAE